MKLLALGLCLACTLSVPQTGLASEVVLPAGTAISVKLADGIDTFRDPAGKQYAAAIDAPVKLASGQILAAGSRATVALVHNNSGWITRLTAVSINGRQFQVSSSAGLLPAKTSATVGTLQRIGLVSAPAIPAAPRLVLAAATELRFELIANVTSAQVTKQVSRKAAPGHAAATRASRSLAFSAEEPLPESGIPYLCRARDNSDRVLPVSYYAADVFTTSDSPAAVEKRWREFLDATYPYRFANNPRAIVQCTRLSDIAAERDARRQLEDESKSENARIVETRWHYRLGPPPAPAQPAAGSR
jgi:hypothetical protein